MVLPVTSLCSQQKRSGGFLWLASGYQHRPAFHIRSVQMGTERTMCCAAILLAFICTAPFVWYGLIITQKPAFVQCEKYITGNKKKLYTKNY